MNVDIKSEITFFIYSEETDLELNFAKTLDGWLFEQKQLTTNKGLFPGIEVKGSFQFTEEIKSEGAIDFSLIRKSVLNKVISHRKQIFTTIVRPFVDALSINLKYPIHIEPKEKWTNDNEIKKDLEEQDFVLKNKGVHSYQSIRIAYSGSEDIIPIYEYFQNNIYNLTTENKKEVSRIVGWLEKGRAQEDYYDEFICYWIAFNALYNLVYQKKSGREIKDNEACKYEFLISKIFTDQPICRTFIDNLRRSNRASIDYLCQLECLSVNGTTDWAQELSRLETQNNFTADYIKKLARCISALRNKLFHGGISLLERDKDLNHCLPLLKELSFNSIHQVLKQRVLI